MFMAKTRPIFRDFRSKSDPFSVKFLGNLPFFCIFLQHWTKSDPCLGIFFVKNRPIWAAHIRIPFLWEYLSPLPRNEDPGCRRTTGLVRVTVVCFQLHGVTKHVYCENAYFIRQSRAEFKNAALFYVDQLSLREIKLNTPESAIFLKFYLIFASNSILTIIFVEMGGQWKNIVCIEAKIPTHQILIRWDRI